MAKLLELVRHSGSLCGGLEEEECQVVLQRAARMDGGKPLKEQNKEFFVKLLSSQAHPHPHLLGYTYIAIVDLHCHGMTAACRRR